MYCHHCHQGRFIPWRQIAPYLNVGWFCRNCWWTTRAPKPAAWQ